MIRCTLLFLLPILFTACDTPSKTWESDRIELDQTVEDPVDFLPIQDQMLTVADQMMSLIDMNSEYGTDMNTIPVEATQCVAGQVHNRLHFTQSEHMTRARALPKSIHGLRRLYHLDQTQFVPNKKLVSLVEQLPNHATDILMVLPLAQDTSNQLQWIEVLGPGVGIASSTLDDLRTTTLKGITPYTPADKWDTSVWKQCLASKWDMWQQQQQQQSSTRRHDQSGLHDWYDFIASLDDEFLQTPCTARFMLWAETSNQIKVLIHQTLFKDLHVSNLSEAYQSFNRVRTKPQSYKIHSTITSSTQPQAGWRWISAAQTLPIAHWIQLAQHPRVLWIAPLAEYPRTLNQESRILMGSEVVQEMEVVNSFNPSYQGLSGQGVRVAIMDSGVANHNDFTKYNNEGTAVGYRIDGALPTEGERHGTVVAGILGGSGHASQDLDPDVEIQPFQWRGQAPEVSMMTSHLMDGTRGATEELAYVQGFVRNHAHLINHSHTQGGGYYVSTSQAYDNFIAYGVDQDELEALNATPSHLVVPRPVFYAAGNQGNSPIATFSRLHGYYGLSVNIKNALTIGSVHSNDAIHTFSSSYGPSLDGRVKPDLVAPGASSFFPPRGLDIEIAEIRLHAKANAPVSDYIWNFHTDTADRWHGSQSLAHTHTQVINQILQAHITSPWRSRLYWHDQPEADEDNPFVIPSIVAEHYEAVSMKVRFQALPTGIQFDQPKDRPPLETKHTYPHYWRFQWGDISNDRYQKTRYITYQDLKADEWTTLRYQFDAGWQGAIARMRISPFHYVNGIFSPSNNGSYGYSSGTSMASPAAAGVASLALQQLQDTLPYVLDETPPSPALVRGLMMHTARDLSFPSATPFYSNHVELDQPATYSIGPDWSTGYGLVDAWALTRLIGVHSLDQRWHENTIQAGEIHRYTIDVQPAGALKVSLVWDDPAGSPLTAEWEQKLVHDLDLLVRDPQGRVYTPWIITPPPLDILNYQQGVDVLERSDITPAYRCVLDQLEDAWPISTSDKDDEIRILSDMFTDTDMMSDTGMMSDIDMMSDTDMNVMTEQEWASRKNRGCIDQLNNYERVEIDLPLAGQYEILIRGHHEGTQAQNYTLIFSQDCSWSPPNQ